MILRVVSHPPNHTPDGQLTPSLPLTRRTKLRKLTASANRNDQMKKNPLSIETEDKLEKKWSKNKLKTPQHVLDKKVSGRRQLNKSKETSALENAVRIPLHLAACNEF